jgi:GNAT superfamily N-acetyltransferase
MCGSRPGPPDRSLGVVALALDDAPGTLDLNKLSIEPRHIRCGVGRALLAQAIAEVRRRGAERLTILADPNAAGFYERTGALGLCACCRSLRSGSLPGRRPLHHFGFAARATLEVTVTPSRRAGRRVNGLPSHG